MKTGEVRVVEARIAEVKVGDVVAAEEEEEKTVG